MKIPHPERAIVDMAKLRGYCLSKNHHRGRHKARVFAATLGLTAENAELLRDALLIAVQNSDAKPTEDIGFGQLYVLDFFMEGPTGKAMVRSGWIVRTGEDFPRLTSCYVL